MLARSCVMLVALLGLVYPSLGDETCVGFSSGQSIDPHSVYSWTLLVRNIATRAASIKGFTVPVPLAQATTSDIQFSYARFTGSLASYVLAPPGGLTPVWTPLSASKTAGAAGASETKYTFATPLDLSPNTNVPGNTQVAFKFKDSLNRPRYLDGYWVNEGVLASSVTQNVAFIAAYGCTRFDCETQSSQAYTTHAWPRITFDLCTPADPTSPTCTPGPCVYPATVPVFPMAGLGSCGIDSCVGTLCNIQCAPGYRVSGRQVTCYYGDDPCPAFGSCVMGGLGNRYFGNITQHCEAAGCPLGYTRDANGNCLGDVNVIESNTAVVVTFTIVFDPADTARPTPALIVGDPVILQQFKDNIVRDLSTALGVPPEVFTVTEVTPVGDDGLKISIVIDVSGARDRTPGSAPGGGFNGGWPFNETSVDIANRLIDQVNNATSPLYDGDETRYLNPTTFLAELILAISALPLGYAILVVACVLLAFVALYLWHKHRFPYAENFLVLTACWSVLTWLSNISLAVWLSQTADDPSIPNRATFSDFTSVAWVFLWIPFAFNLCLAYWVVRREHRQNPGFRLWMMEHPYSMACVSLLSGIKMNNMRLSRSQVLGLLSLSAPFVRQTDFLLQSLGLVGTVLSDIPLVALMIAVLLSSNGNSEFVIVPLCATCISIAFAATTRGLAAREYVKTTELPRNSKLAHHKGPSISINGGGDLAGGLLGSGSSSAPNSPVSLSRSKVSMATGSAGFAAATTTAPASADATATGTGTGTTSASLVLASASGSSNPGGGGGGKLTRSTSLPNVNQPRTRTWAASPSGEVTAAGDAATNAPTSRKPSSPPRQPSVSRQGSTVTASASSSRSSAAPHQRQPSFPSPPSPPRQSSPSSTGHQRQPSNPAAPPRSAPLGPHQRQPSNTSTAPPPRPHANTTAAATAASALSTPSSPSSTFTTGAHLLQRQPSASSVPPKKPTRSHSMQALQPLHTPTGHSHLQGLITTGGRE